jgi:D-alanine-D-alanine ligase
VSKKKISIVCGGPSSEYEVSLNSTESMLKHLDKDKYTPYVFYISMKGNALLYKAKDLLDIPEEKDLNNLFDEVKKLKDMDMNVLALHGEFGEDGTFQSILEFLQIPFTGCRSTSSSLCMDKYRSGLIVEKEIDVKVPKTGILKLKDLISNYKYTEDICIKPNYKGSSVGVFMIQNQEELDSALKKLKKIFDGDMDVIVQPLIRSDIEVSCGCLETKDGEFVKLPAIEIMPQSSTFFDYEAKYVKGASIEITPPEYISKKLAEKVSQLAVDIHKILGCTLYSRSDFLIKGDNIYYLETNTFPGMTNTSLLPQEANAAGINFTQLLDFFIENS